MPSFQLASSVLALTLASSALAQGASCPAAGTCQSYGIDFASGGTYFQNSLSTDPFTAIQEFAGCQNDTSNNILIDPSGNSYQCTDTPLLPNDTPGTLSCPIDKDQLSSGDYSLIVISNNGNCDPIAYERDFCLTVGPQQTTTVTPTLIVNTAITPIVNATVTSTSTITSTAKTSTTTVPAINIDPTITIYPLAKYTTVTHAVLTLTSTKDVPHIVATSTAQATASCSLPTPRDVKDPVCTTVPSNIPSDLQNIIKNVLGLLKRDTKPQPTARSGSTEFKRAIIEGRAADPEAKAEWLLQRHNRLAAQKLNKRSPDEPTVTVTDTSAAPITVTSTTATAAASTVYVSVVQTSTTVTTPIKTVSEGIQIAISTTTASQSTITDTVQVHGTVVYVTQTTDATLTITSTTTPSAVAASCSSSGGALV